LDVELGIVEGYFGPPWSFAERRATMAALREHGYRFFNHAPKADAYLRQRWREPHPAAACAALADFAAACRAQRTRFGVGLSPFEAWLDFGAASREALRGKLAQLDEIGIDDQALLFDDMRGDLPDLAERQAEIVDFAAGRTRATRLIVCPTYYSDDPLLDRVFGARPAGYLEDLGRMLDPSIDIFWTGEAVCSRAFSLEHLEGVAARLRRRPFLWDNYPVNDGPRMSEHLHLRPFSGRPAALAGVIAAHAINPALQATLTRLPAFTLARSYAAADRYREDEAFRVAAEVVVGAELAAVLAADLPLLHDAGRERLGGERSRWRERYAAFDHDAAREVLRWLDGDYAWQGEAVRTQ
jgi:hypothetical protein